MFGMGLFEILLIAVVAIIALGPEKLPTAMIEVARFFKKFKNGLDEAKSTLDNELKLSDMKEEASKFKAQIESIKSSAKFDDLNMNNILDDDNLASKNSKQKKNSIFDLDNKKEVEQPKKEKLNEIENIEKPSESKEENPFKLSQVKIEEIKAQNSENIKESNK